MYILQLQCIIARLIVHAILNFVRVYEFCCSCKCAHTSYDHHEFNSEMLVLLIHLMKCMQSNEDSNVKTLLHEIM